ncbi:MAG TPA: hypothetical protein VMI54_18330 [Polyangiaceae bacterium]|nr:hypothetical protein [Polyangiaceae bacterium]
MNLRDESTLLLLTLLTLAWSVIAIALLPFGGLVVFGALPLAAFSFVTGCCALYLALGRAFLSWVARVATTLLLWCGVVLPAFGDVQIITIGGHGEPLLALAAFFYGLPWCWVLLSLWTFVISKLAASERRLVRDDPSRGRRDAKRIVLSGSIAGIVVTVLLRSATRDLETTLVAAACAAVYAGSLFARFPAALAGLVRASKTQA